MRDTLGNYYARRDIGPMLGEINTALLGWKPSTEHGPLVKGNSPRAPYMPGFAYFPQVFTTAIPLEGDPNLERTHDGNRR